MTLTPSRSHQLAATRRAAGSTERRTIWFGAAALFVSASPLGLNQVALVSTICGLILLDIILRRGAWQPRYWGAPAALFLVFVFASALWSSRPDETIAGGWNLLVFGLLGAYFASVLDARDLVDSVGAGFKLVLTASWAAYFALPSYGRVQSAYEAGALQGIAYHRNYMGYLATLGLLVFLLQTKQDPATRKRAVLWAVVAAAAVVTTRSQTSLVLATLASFIFLLFARLIRSNSRARGAGIFAALVMMSAAFWFLLSRGTQVIEGLGRDLTFTGRTDIWAAVLDVIGEAPLGGVGWKSMWGDGDPGGTYVRGSVHFYINHAHNGYLDVGSQLGWTGVALLALVMATVFLRGVVRAQAERRPDMLWAAVTTLTIAGFDVLETRSTMNTGWMLLVLMSVLVRTSATTAARNDHISPLTRQKATA